MKPMVFAIQNMVIMWLKRHAWASVRLMGALLLGLLLGWYLAPVPPDPKIVITRIDVQPVTNESGTVLTITTRYQNRGCEQILLARFLLNTRPTPSIALPQQHGPTVLPPGANELIETVSLDFALHAGQWHMFSVASCYVAGLPVPDSTVSPTALFDV